MMISPPIVEKRAGMKMRLSVVVLQRHQTADLRALQLQPKSLHVQKAVLFDWCPRWQAPAVADLAVSH